MNSEQTHLKEIETNKLKEALMATQELNSNKIDSCSSDDIVEKVTEELKRLITDDLDENISELDNSEGYETKNSESKVKAKPEAEAEVEVEIFVDASTVLLDSKHEVNSESKGEVKKISIENEESKAKDASKISDKKKAKNFRKKSTFKKKRNTSDKKAKSEKENEGADCENFALEPKEQSEGTEVELNVCKTRNNPESKPYYNNKQSAYKNHYPLNSKGRKSSYGNYFEDIPPLIVRDFSDGFASRPRYNNFKPVHYNGYRPNYQNNNFVNHGAPVHIHPNRIHSNPNPNQPFRPIRRRNVNQYNQWSYYTPLDNRDQFYGHNPFQKNNQNKTKDFKSQDNKENVDSFTKKRNIQKRHRKRSLNQEASSKNVIEKSSATEEGELTNDPVLKGEQEQKLEDRELEPEADLATVSQPILETTC